MLLKSLYVLGDIGYYGNTLRQVISNFKYNTMLGNDEVVLLGDNFYPDGLQSKFDNQWNKYELAFQDVPYRNIYSVMGNHDYYGNPFFQINSKYLANNQLYFKKNFQDMDLYFIDTVLLYKNHVGITDDIIKDLFNTSHRVLKEQQLEWLDYNLENSKLNNRKTIVFGHYPIISNGLYANDLDPLYDTLMPLFSKYKVDVYISGHEHNIQYIEKKVMDYNFKQVIIGSSSEYRSNEYRIVTKDDMYDNEDNYYLQLYKRNNRICLDFKNKNGIIKYSYEI
jgi:predicted phosphodiesterase